MLVHNRISWVRLGGQIAKGDHEHLQRGVDDDEDDLGGGYLVRGHQHWSEDGVGRGEFVQDYEVGDELKGVKRKAEPIFLRLPHCIDRCYSQRRYRFSS